MKGCNQAAKGFHYQHLVDLVFVTQIISSQKKELREY